MKTQPIVETDGYKARFGKPLFTSLWTKALGSQYPADVQPYSSCTKELLQQLVEQVDCTQESVLVDLGCGTGGVGLWIARALHCKLIGIDQSESAIEIAATRTSDWGVSGTAEFHVAQFSDMGLATASVDAIISIDALPFAQDINSALTELRRVLRSNGRLVFTAREPRKHGPAYRKLDSSWNEALIRNGFETVKVLERKGVSDLWRAIYDQWLLYEQELRAEISDELVDRMLDEVSKIGPKLVETRPWLLITAQG